MTDRYLKPIVLIFSLANGMVFGSAIYHQIGCCSMT